MKENAWFALKMILFLRVGSQALAQGMTIEMHADMSLGNNRL